MRTVVAASNLLTGVLSLGPWEERLLKYHLDQIQKLHGLDGFKQAKPILVNVELKVPLEKGVFPADLKFVRQEISRIHPNIDVLFNLKIIGLTDGRPSISLGAIRAFSRTEKEVTTNTARAVQPEKS